MNEVADEIPSYSIESLRTINTRSEPRDFEFFRFEYFAKDIEHLSAPHRHDFYTFILVTDGHGSHDIDFQKFELKPNRLFLIAPGQVHAWNQLSHVKGFVVLFTDGFVALSRGRKIMSSWPLFRLNQSAFVDLTLEEGKVWTEEFLFMESESAVKDLFSRDAIYYSIGKLLVRASRLYAKNVKAHGPDMLFNFQELVEKHYKQKRKPLEYASILNITPNYLNSVIKQRSGKSAGELIRQRIILEAKRFLAHTTIPVSQIAYHLGFDDNSYFGRFFKKYTNQTPEQFRATQK